MKSSTKSLIVWGAVVVFFIGIGLAIYLIRRYNNAGLSDELHRIKFRHSNTELLLHKEYTELNFGMWFEKGIC